MDVDGSEGLPEDSFRRGGLERDLTEILGIVKGTLADGIVVDTEIAFLHQWAETHPEALAHWPVRAVYERIHRHLGDGAINEPERRDLQDLLLDLIAGTLAIEPHADHASAFDEPAAKIVWQDSVFVFTGKLAYGTRDECEREVFRRGGTCEADVTQRTSYLVVGSFDERDRARSRSAKIIARAEELRASGARVRVITEDQWARQLGQPIRH
jgi:NAD-dependent DNA ligase